MKNKITKVPSAKHFVTGSTGIECDGRIYWAVHNRSVMFLIPKKRGIGFLRQPVGHHVNELSTLITSLGYDCCGLDGYLDVNTGYTGGQDFTELVNEISVFLNAETVNVHSHTILDWVVR